MENFHLSFPKAVSQLDLEQTAVNVQFEQALATIAMSLPQFILASSSGRVRGGSGTRLKLYYSFKLHKSVWSLDDGFLVSESLTGRKIRFPHFHQPHPD